MLHKEYREGMANNVHYLDLLCGLLHLGEAVLGIVCDVDGPVDLNIM